ncbi:MAG: porin [Pseudomonadota bacterium]
MKKILVATTALVAVAAAGSAYADGHEGGVSVSLSADIGFESLDGVNGFGHDYDLSWSGSTVTDGGLTVAASGNADDETSPSVSVSGGFGSIAFGDEDDALDAAMGGIDGGDTTSGAADLAGADASVGEDPLLYTSPDLGGATAYVSVSLEGSAENTTGETGFGAGASLSLGGISVGGGFSQLGDASLAGVSAGLGAGPADVKVAFQTGEDAAGNAISNLDASAAADLGGNTVGVQFVTDLEAETNGFAVFYSQGLGGGVTLNAAFGQDQAEATNYGVSLAASF